MNYQIRNIITGIISLYLISTGIGYIALADYANATIAILGAVLISPILNTPKWLHAIAIIAISGIYVYSNGLT